jgi:ubiquinone/menaquinone biosynthesis C-methylase UbiE
MSQALRKHQSFLWNIYGHVYDGLLHFWPYQNLLKQVNQKADLKAGERVLDLGCGTGNVLEMILDVPQTTAIGVDVSASMLAQARKKLQAEVQEGRLVLENADLLSFLKSQPTDSFDKIIMSNVLYAVADRQSIWQEIKRVLKPKGVVVVATALSTNSWPIIREHFQHAPFWSALRPSLLAVFLVDGLINIFGQAGSFEFPSEDLIFSEIIKAGGSHTDSARVYGGVDILFVVTFR